MLMRSLHINDALARIPQGSVLPTEGGAKLESSLERLMGRRATKRLLHVAGLAGATRMPAVELAAIAQVSLKVAERVVAAREFGHAIQNDANPRISCAADVLDGLPAGYREAETEILLGLVLTAKLVVQATVVFAKGGVASAAVSARDIFVPLVRLGSHAFILIHNHPSGDPTPSREDVELTNTVTRAGILLGIQLLDHLVVASGGFVSFSETGLLPTERDLRKLATEARAS